MDPKEHKLLDLVRNYLPFTGSRAWGVEQEDSDWDYFGTNQQVTQIFNEAGVLPGKYMMETAGYLEVSETVFDLPYETHVIMLDDLHYRAWCQATELMRLFPKSCIRNKANRKELFGRLVTGFLEDYNSLSDEECPF
jgi:hypothetical protein